MNIIRIKKWDDVPENYVGLAIGRYGFYKHLNSLDYLRYPNRYHVRYDSSEEWFESLPEDEKIEALFRADEWKELNKSKEE